jgi:XTP/dITP diphosphohydrolase
MKALPKDRLRLMGMRIVDTIASARPMPQPRSFQGDALLIATHNPGKVPEIAALLDGLVGTFVTSAALGLPEPEETETSYGGNARLKALAAASASGLIALADDSGLSVEALDGAPGVLSARWAGPGKDFKGAMAKVEAALAALDAGSVAFRQPYRASFICALALAWPDGHTETVEACWPGQLVFPGRGQRGFGYDPIFMPDGFALTCAEMDPDIKHRHSHRARAFAALRARCFSSPV